MGTPHTVTSVVLTASVFSSMPKAIELACAHLSRAWTPPLLVSDYLPFNETVYYADTMGNDLQIQLMLFDQLIDPIELAQVKLRTNDLENMLTKELDCKVIRPVNIDPGYITIDQFVLATTKKASHRIYIGSGIYGEVTLRYHHGGWQNEYWTYPNYRRQDHKNFFSLCRQTLLHNSRLDGQA